MSDNLFVSIIIPCRNEERFIGKCLESIAEQDYPKDNLEVLVIDGKSEDKTREIVKDFSLKYPYIKLLDNPQKFTPFALNIGIREARGDVIVRIDAHAGYEKDYVSKCLWHLKESGADNVGGIIKTLPSINTISARAIAFVLSHPFGAASYFRKGSKEARCVDTVFGGCFKREVFDKVGLFNEKMVRSQDIEFNKRLKRAGGKILLVPEIIARYYPQTTLKGFFRHNFQDGFWTIYPLSFGVRFFSLRHLIPLILVAGFLTGLVLGMFLFWGKVLFILIFGSYLLLNLIFSLEIALREGLKLFPALTLSFFSRHFGYGLGSIWGLIKIVLSRTH
ncbi:MAG: glycosyltransferase family 2 protein [bacterium]